MRKSVICGRRRPYYAPLCILCDRGCHRPTSRPLHFVNGTDILALFPYYFTGLNQILNVEFPYPYPAEEIKGQQNGQNAARHQEKDSSKRHPPGCKFAQPPPSSVPEGQVVSFKVGVSGRMLSAASERKSTP